ncbi:MUB1/samB family protein [Pleurotus pulmonarius]
MTSRTKLNQICQFCRRSPRTELKKCHKCGSVSYCSYACQREDLTNHQRACRVAREGVLIPPLDFLKTKKEKERLTEILTALCNDLSRWMEAKSSALLERCINELGLKYTPDACETHVLRVVVSRDEMWPSSTSTPGELFTVTKFEVMSVRYARESMILWKDCMRELEIQRQEAKANGLGMIAVVGVECPALATVRLLQFTGVGKYLLAAPAESSQRSHRRARR